MSLICRNNYEGAPLELKFLRTSRPRCPGTRTKDMEEDPCHLWKRRHHEAPKRAGKISRSQADAHRPQSLPRTLRRSTEEWDHLATDLPSTLATSRICRLGLERRAHGCRIDPMEVLECRIDPIEVLHLVQLDLDLIKLLHLVQLDLDMLTMRVMGVLQDLDLISISIMPMIQELQCLRHMIKTAGIGAIGMDMEAKDMNQAMRVRKCFATAAESMES